MIKYILSFLIVAINTYVFLKIENRLSSIVKCLLAMGLIYALCYAINIRYGADLYSSSEMLMILIFGLSSILLFVLNNLMNDMLGEKRSGHFVSAARNFLIRYVMMIGITVYQMLMIWTDILSSMNIPDGA